MKHLSSRIAFLFACCFLASSLYAQPAGKKILVEKITSVGCPGCPWGGYILDSLSQLDADIIPVAIHVHDQWHIDSMRSVQGDSILDVYLWAHPTLMIDRVKFPNQTRVPVVSNFWSTNIATRKLDPLAVSIGATSTYDANSRQLSVTVAGEVLDGLTGDVRVNAYVVESPVVGTGLGYDQLNAYNNSTGHPLAGLGNPIVGYQHKWVLREILGGTWGQAGIIPDPAPVNSNYAHTFTTTLNSDWNDANCYLVVLVQRFNSDLEQRTVLNALQLDLNESIAASVEEEGFQPEIRIYPHPVTSHSYIANPFTQATRLSLHDVQGRLIREQELYGEVMIDFLKGDLTPGLYFIQLWSGRDKLALEKLLVR